MRIAALFVVMIALMAVLNAHASPPPICDNAALGQRMQASLHDYQGKRILVLAGGIVWESDSDNSARDVAPYIRNSRSYEEVWICSGGGSVNAGIKIGGALNRERATVRTPNNYQCASACTIASMGGYARIIDPDARFVTHASSAFQSFGFSTETNAQTGETDVHYSHFGRFRCDESRTRPFCDKLRQFIASEGLTKFACDTPRDVSALNTDCAYFDTDGRNYNRSIIDANALLSVFAGKNPELVAWIVSDTMDSSLKHEADLLEYFQTMLLDGRSDLVTPNIYASIKSNFSPISIYDLPSSQLYARDLSTDVAAFIKADATEAFALWQTIMTDSELSVKTQLSRHIAARRIDLGPGGKDALKMFDAMRTCQIQSTCRLEPHTARALGYHNMYDYE